MESVQFDVTVGEILANAGLPIDDLDGNKNVLLFGKREHGKLLGLVGIEGNGTDALLRSLVVSAFAQNRGLGRSLVGYAENRAFLNGARSLYLLTTTEAVFFNNLGYKVTARDAAPAAISATAQFSNLCPGTAVCMVKRLDDIAQPANP